MTEPDEFDLGDFEIAPVEEPDGLDGETYEDDVRYEGSF